MPNQSANLRRAARVVVLSPADNVLLVEFKLRTGTFWATPGGGLEGDESHAQAARRELLEETGIVDVELVGPIWERTHYFPLHGFDGQNEHYFLAHADDETVNPQFSEQELLWEGVNSLRWWSVAEVASSSEVFAPRDLGIRLQDLLRDGPPAETIRLPDQRPNT